MTRGQPDRLAGGGRVDRSRPLTFSFNGRALEGFAGDSLASAMLANGVRLVGRSFKYHRPRGIVGSGAEEPNAIVQVGTGAATTPNVRATEMELHDGLTAFTVKGWPSLNFDLMAATDWFHRLFVAGFYYKTFMRPRALWNLYEHFIRRTAGLGVAPELPDPDAYAHFNAHCDVLVAGAGPAGLMAALAAARCGARVIVADERSEPGGSLLRETSSLNGGAAFGWLEAVLGEMSENPDVTVLPRSTVFGYYDQNFLTIVERCREEPVQNGREGAANLRQRLWRVRAKRVVLATGACERPLVFANNDRPGVMLASAVSEYIHRYAVRPGSRAVVFTNNDGGYRVALDLANAGAEARVVDSRIDGAGPVTDIAARAGIEVRTGYAVSGVAGRLRVRSAEIVPLSADGGARHRLAERVGCDLVAMAGGWSPVVHLHSQAGGSVIWDESLGCFVPGETRQGNISAGAAAGNWELGACLEEGRKAGLDAARHCGYGTAAVAVPQTEPEISNPASFFWRTPSLRTPERSPREFVDYQNDTTLSDIRLAVREGYRSVEHVKRYTALGFGTDQGKLGNVNGFAALAECLDVPVGEVGTTTFRPAYTPVAFGACAGMHVGDLYEPVRKTALHEWHEAAGAEFEVVGQWLRPWYFPAPGEDMDAAVARECRAARESLAIMDASTLGKIEVRGPDAVTFLERIYTHRVGDMKVGRCAYGIMLGEDGMVFDDGVTARLGEDHYYLTTTTGGAAAVLDWLEWWLQTEWPELQVYCTSVTDRWSTIVLAGPNSRKVLQGLESDIALDSSDFPFMSLRSGRLAGYPVRVFRVSFSGELAFEVNVESDCAMAVWELFMEAGKAYGITPYGTEAMHVLRAEKGFVIVGQDTDGSVNPVDLGMNWLLAKDRDYLGKRSLKRPDSRRTDRQQWVGLLSEDGSTVLPEGAQLVEEPQASPPVPLLGHVTSSYMSACLGHPIALGLVSGGRARRGETIHAALRDGRFVRVKIASSVFYDPKGERQRV
ncbi:MAG: sarcosine oxidase subunit alpha family protein [Gammaproteobacteria bacterium]|nr:sarcosine oxidase subunit alpha family protein [Gammaproteobacteria bacterium]MDE0367731.1 sarcosine oxidase subunit alpha family protein [Gammaproteobacteria bacterium]